MVKQLAEHSVDVSILKRDSLVMDVGCRNFAFAQAIGAYVDTVICIDADPEVRNFNPDPNRFGFLNRAITSTEHGLSKFIKHGNGTGNYVDDGRSKPKNYQEVEVTTKRLDMLHHKDSFVRYWDVIKLDIEGAEIEALLSLSGPVARQLTVEFHMHTGTPEKRIEAVFDHLTQWYDIVHGDYSDKHGCGMNWWDVLFVLQKERR